MTTRGMSIDNIVELMLRDGDEQIKTAVQAWIEKVMQEREENEEAVSE
jgi:hypothetical protein